MKRSSMKRAIGAGAATLAMAIGLLVVPAQAASACTFSTNLNATSASVSKGNDCIGSVDKVQARISRYYNSTIYTYYGAEGTWSSTATNSTGTQAGGAYRSKSTISGSWSGWNAI